MTMISMAPPPPAPADGGIPPDIAQLLRTLGPVIDIAGTKALYAPLLAQQPRGSVCLLADLAYGSDARHRADVYLPASAPARPRALLVFIHGGGFIRGDKSERANVAWQFAQEGFVVVLPNYRLGPMHRWPAGAEDVSAVLEWVAVQAPAWNAGSLPVILAGESAGAAHAAASTLVQRLRPDPQAAPLGVVLISGTYNARLEALSRKQFGIATPDPRNEAYFGPDLAAWDGMSTVDLMDASPFPLLITYAELDPPQMQVQAGELFARLVSRQGFAPVLQVIRGHNHLSQLQSIGTGDDTLTGVLRRWMVELLDEHTSSHH